jgi:signal transduction histidine kinase
VEHQSDFSTEYYFESGKNRGALRLAVLFLVDRFSDRLLHPDAESFKLEQAARCESDFLANMSLELRTPLNSSLILIKLLADNPDENLTEEQVKYVQTDQRHSRSFQDRGGPCGNQA